MPRITPISYHYIQGTVHVPIRGAGHTGRTLWVPAPGLTPLPTGGLRVRATGKRPPLRAHRAIRPQVQACKLPTAHPASIAAQGAQGVW